MPFCRIAIVGAGFAGSALAYFLRDREVTLFDRGGGASAIAPGLLHPRPGCDAEFAAATDLISIAGEDVIRSRGILRIPKKPQDYTWSAEQCQRHFPGSTIPGGIYYPDGMTIDTSLYLDRLLELSNTTLIKEEVAHLSDLDDYDAVILAAGAATAALTPLEFTPVKGQLLQITWPADLPPPSCSVIGSAYLTSNFLVGSTYEYNFEDHLPYAKEAAATILPKIATIYPQLATAHVVGCFAAIRARAPAPICHQISPRLFVLTALGSHGLLHHAHLARRLVSTYF